MLSAGPKANTATTIDFEQGGASEESKRYRAHVQESGAEQRAQCLCHDLLSHS